MKDRRSRPLMPRMWLLAPLALLVTSGILGVLTTASATAPGATPMPLVSTPPVLAPAAPAAKPQGLRALDGEWIYVEDKTRGRALEQLGPPMASKFMLQSDEAGTGAVILNGHGSGHKDVRVALDGSMTEIVELSSTSRYRGSWKDSTFEYQVEFERPGNASDRSIRTLRRSFQITPEGLLVRVVVDPPVVKDSIGLYRRAEEIEMPTGAKAAIGDLEWLGGAWVGMRSSGSSIEERWSPPLGGAMLAVSRSVNTKGTMVAFEYLRVVERDGGLVYIAQPGGKTPTEFVLTELTTTRAVFENPRHDYPKRIVYELTAEGADAGLIATIGYTKGGTPRRFEYKREGK